METNLFRRSGDSYWDASSQRATEEHSHSGRRETSRDARAARGRRSSTRRANYRVTARDLQSPLQLIADIAVITALSTIAGTTYHLGAYGLYGPIPTYIYTGLVVAFLFKIAGRLAARERADTLTHSFDRIISALKSWTLAFSALVFIIFALKAGVAESRGAIFTFYIVGLPIIAAWHVFTPIALVPIAKKIGLSSQTCIILGDSADSLVDAFTEELKANGNPEPTLIRFSATCTPNLWPQELKRLNDEVKTAAHQLPPGPVFLCTGAMPVDRLKTIYRVLSILPRTIFVVPDAQTAQLVRCRPSTVGGFVALEARREPLGSLQRLLKRLLDLSVASIALIFLAPFFMAVALLIKLDSRGPVFFRQTRNGYCGRPFEILKFRSMSVQENGTVIRQASRDDVRVTGVGRFLRKSSIDELPQLVNVLLGEMSLVGPRPHAVAHDELYGRAIENYEVRQHVKPGITGWAQVNGLRGETATLDAMYRRIELDLWYAANASLLLDLEILLRTVIEVCRQRNAY